MKTSLELKVQPRRRFLKRRNRLIVKAVERGMSYAEAAEKFGLTSVRIGQIVRQAGRVPARQRKLPERSVVIQHLVEKRMTQAEVASLFGVSRQRIGQILKEEGLTHLVRRAPGFRSDLLTPPAS